jgi:FMN-dependent NADH-azoreductase
MNILHINANPKPQSESASLTVTEAFFAGLREAAPTAQVTRVDLHNDPPPYFSHAEFRNFWYPVFQQGYEPTPEEQETARYAERHCELFNQADYLVLTAPMWNFSIPGILKAWVDQVLMPGLTFSYGPEGLQTKHRIKKVIVLSASGGVYEEGDGRDHAVPLLRAQMGFLGIDDVEAISADGQNIFFFKDSEERKQRAAKAARDLGTRLTRGGPLR